MGELSRTVALPVAEPARVAAAVEAVLTEDAARVARLRTGASQTALDEPDDPVTARLFQALLEIGYLVASADGFADSERAALAGLLERVTGAAAPAETLTRHFADLDAAVAMLGRRERLGRVAAELDDAPTREEAITLSALIAMADGHLDAQEVDVLVALGEHCGLAADAVMALVRDAARRVEEVLG